MEHSAANALINRAIDAAERGDLKGALETIEIVVAAGWVSADLANFKAFLEHALRRPRVAEQSLHLAMGIEPDHWTSFVLLAVIRMTRGDLAGAEAAIAEAGRIEPKNAFNHVMSAQLIALQAIAFEDRRLIDSAVLQWDKAMRMAPEITENRYLYADFLLLHGRLRAARNQANTALAQQPQSDKPHALLAAIHIAEGRLRDAAENLKNVERLNPSNPSLLRLRAEIEKPGAWLLGKWIRWSTWVFLDPTRARAFAIVPGMLLALTFAYGADAAWWLALCFVSTIPLTLASIGLRLKRRQLS